MVQRLARAGLACLAMAGLAACAKPYVAPLLPGPYTEQIEAPYEQVWRALGNPSRLEPRRR